MRITIDVLDEYVTRWGAFVIINPNYQAKEMPIYLPGFDYAAPEGVNVFQVKVDLNERDKDRIARLNTQQEKQPAGTEKPPDGAKVDGTEQDILPMAPPKPGKSTASEDTSPKPKPGKDN